MKRIVLASALIAAAALATGCNRPDTTSNNSGTSASTAPVSSTSTPTADTSSTAPSSTMSTTTTTTGMPASSDTSVMGDTVTTGKIKAAIAADSGLKDTDISVKTEGGVVMLTGSAKSQDQITIATNLAQRQDGVSRVDNQVTVK